MKIFLLILLTVVAFVGVVLTWRQRGQQQEPPAEEDARLSPLLRGINYLLSDEPDRALQEMVQAAKLRSEAADVYMALGAMFRARGEFTRAVRIHQNLLARPDLTKEMQLQARFALAQDFHAGGLLDRALKQYTKVLAIDSGHLKALEGSLRIREQGGDWAEAEEVLARLDRVRNTHSDLHRAYLLAELARAQRGKPEEMARLAEQAATLAPDCASALLLLLEFHLARGDAEASAAMLRRMIEHSPSHLPLALALLLGHPEFYRTQGEPLLLAYWQQSRDEALALSWAEQLERLEGGSGVRALLDRLDYRPASLRASLRLAALSETGDPLLLHHARDWRRRVKNHVCGKCGVEVVELRWQCPGCHEWGSMRPLGGGEI